MDSYLEQHTIAMEEHLEALNQLNYLNISNESFSEFIKKMLDRLIRMIGFLIRDTEDHGFLSIQINSLHQSIETLALETRTKALYGREPYFTVHTYLPSLIFRNRPINKIQTLSGQFTKLTAVTKAFGAFQNQLANNKDIARVGQNDLALLTSILETTNPLHVLSKYPDAFTADTVGLTSDHLLNNKRIVVTSSYGNAFKDIGVNIVNSDEDPKPLPEYITFERFPTTYQIALLRKLKEHVTMLGTEFGIRPRYTRATMLKTLQRNMTHMSNIVEKNPDLEEAQLREIVVYLTTYIKWFTGSYIEVLQLNMRVIKSLLNVCTLNLNQPK